MPEIARFRFCSRGSVRPGDHTDRVAWLADWLQNLEQAVEADEKGFAGWSNHPQLQVEMQRFEARKKWARNAADEPRACAHTCVHDATIGIDVMKKEISKSPCSVLRASS